MEWSKTKTYLIIALLITNIILIFSIYSDRKNSYDNFGKKNLKNLEKFLSDRNIKSNVKLNTDTSKLSSIELKYAKLGDEELANIKEKYEDKINIIDDIYIRLRLNTAYMTDDDLLKFSKKFIEDNFQKNSYRLKTHYSYDSVTVLEYEELYEGMFIEHGYVRFSYKSKDSIDISIVKLRDIHKVKKAIDIISNAEAVSKILSQISKDEIITDIKLGYYGIEDLENSGTRKIRLIPFWRIKMNNKRFLYTEAIKN